MNAHRLLIPATVTVLALGLTSIGTAARAAEAAPPTTSGPPAARLIGTTSPATAGDSPTTGAPDPPIDAVGRPAASTVARSDVLRISKTPGDQSTTQDQWAQTTPDMSSFSARGPAGNESSRTLLNPLYATTAARILDPLTDRTLSFSHRAVGSSNGLLRLSSNDDAAEPQWHEQDKANAEPTPGDTYVLSLPDGTTAAEDTGSPGVGAHLLAASAGKATRQQWSLVIEPNDEGWYRLVNRSDGLCARLVDSATAPDAQVSAFECADDDVAAVESWKPLPMDGGGYRLVPKAAQTMALTRDGSTLVQHTIDDSRAADQRWTFTRIYEPGGVVPTWSTPSSDDPSVPTAMAAGDLDRVVGPNGQYGDEAVVAYGDAEGRLQVRVIDYNANASHRLVSAPSVPLPLIGSESNGAPWYPGSLGVAIGDFDGDLLNDILVTWQDSKGAFHGTILKYAADDADNDQSRALTVVTADRLLLDTSHLNPSLIDGMASTASGDFDGDGQDDVAIGFAEGSTADHLTPFLGTVSFGSDLTTEPAVPVRVAERPYAAANLLRPPQSSDNTFAPHPTWTAHGVRMVAGLFRYEPAKGFTEHRRELAMAWTWDDGDKNLTTYANIYDIDAKTSAVTYQTQPVLVHETPFWRGMKFDAARNPLMLVAGGFAGPGKGDDVPVWGLAFSDVGTVEIWAPSGPDFGGLSWRLSSTEDPTTATNVALTAYDRSGTSVLLGAPIVMTVNKLVKATLIAAQPPAHTDWLNGKFVNVSRSPDFNVQLGSGSQTSYSGSHQSKASTTLGVAEGLDAKATAKLGLFGVASLGGSAELEQKFNQSWDKEHSDYSKYSTTITQSETATATDDDIVDAYLATSTVYRYPILGAQLTTDDGDPVTTPTCAKDCKGYYEVTIPGATTPIHGSGRGFGWYQPSWQNGNALSYPKLVDDQVPIPDLGSYSFTDDNNNTVTRRAAMFNATNDLGPVKRAYDMAIGQGSGSGHVRTTGGTKTNSQEVKLGISAMWNTGVTKTKYSLDASIGVTEGSTWADTDTGDTAETSSSTFELNVPQIDAAEAYGVGTAYYTDAAGERKVIHGVDLTESNQGKGWWEAFYGKHPDLALNLPLSTVMTLDDLNTYTTPKWSPLENRQHIRGFWALQPKDDASPATSGVPYASNPNAGDPVTFAVQIHNYSLMSADPSSASFYAVPVDALGQTIKGARSIDIGTAKTPQIAGQGMATIESPQWKALGVPNGSGLQNWRIFVVLDPGDSLGELHPWKHDPASACPASSIDDIGLGTTLVDPMTGEPETLVCGQNNQGYGEISVMSGVPQGPHDPGKVSLDGGGLLTGGLTAPAPGGVPRIVLGQSVQGVVRTKSTADTHDNLHVLVFDGPPRRGQLVADTRLAGSDRATGGNAVFDWRPLTAGRHVLHEVMLATDGSEQIQKMTVRVHAHGAVDHLSIVPPTRSVSLGAPHAFRAFTVDSLGNRVREVSERTAFAIAPEGSCTSTSCTAQEAGPHTVTGTATVGGHPMTGSTSVDVATATVAQLSVVSGNGQSARPTKPFAHRLVARAADATGAAALGAPVTFRVVAGSARFPGGHTLAHVTAASTGVATAPALRAGPRSGPVVVSAVNGSATALFLESVAPGRPATADLRVHVSGRHTVRRGSPRTVGIRVTNRGPSASARGLLAVALPARVRLVGAHGGRRVGAGLVYRVPGLARGHSRTFRLRIATRARTAHTGRLLATVLSTTADPRMYNNSYRLRLRIG